MSDENRMNIGSGEVSLHGHEALPAMTTAYISVDNLRYVVDYVDIHLSYTTYAFICGVARSLLGSIRSTRA